MMGMSGYLLVKLRRFYAYVTTFRKMGFIPSKFINDFDTTELEKTRRFYSYLSIETCDVRSVQGHRKRIRDISLCIP